MNSLLVASAVVLALSAGVAAAQTTSSEITTTSTPVIVAPPDGTLSVTRTQRTINPDGSQINSNETTYRNNSGVADETVTKTTNIPSIDEITTKKSTTTTIE